MIVLCEIVNFSSGLPSDTIVLLTQTIFAGIKNLGEAMAILS